MVRLGLFTIIVSSFVAISGVSISVFAQQKCVMPQSPTGLVSEQLEASELEALSDEMESFIVAMDTFMECRLTQISPPSESESTEEEYLAIGEEMARVTEMVEQQKQMAMTHFNKHIEATRKKEPIAEN